MMAVVGYIAVVIFSLLGFLCLIGVVLAVISPDEKRSELPPPPLVTTRVAPVVLDPGVISKTTMTITTTRYVDAKTEVRHGG